VIQVAESRIASVLDDLESAARGSVTDFLSRGYAVGYLQGAISFAYTMGLIGYGEYERRLAVVTALAQEAREGSQPASLAEEDPA